MVHTERAIPQAAHAEATRSDRIAAIITSEFDKVASDFAAGRAISGVLAWK